MKSVTLVSLKTLIVCLIAGCFLLVIVSSFVLQSAALRQISEENLEHAGATLAASGELQVSELLPALLLKEEYSSLEYVLERLRDKEGLVSAQFDTGTAFPAGRGTCRKLDARSWLCADAAKNQVTSIHRADLEGTPMGYLIKVKQGSSRSWTELRRPLVTAYLLTLGVFLAAILAIAFAIDKWVRAPLLSLGETLEPALRERKAIPADETRIFEIRSVFSQVRNLVERLQNQHGELMVARLSSQVAHDIRSPLTALSCVADSVSALPDEEKALLVASIDRIRSIADGLLESRRQAIATASSTEWEMPSTLEESQLADIAEETRKAIAEKRIELGTGSRVCIDGPRVREGAALFSKVQVSEFRRVLSNLLNNAVEAIDGAGKVRVELSAQGSLIDLRIRDTGKGIAADLLPVLREGGVSFGKAKGNGLGILHARNALQRWGGGFDIRSSAGEGAEVILTLPCLLAPQWLLAKLEVPEGTSVTIVEDDATVHQLWRMRLEGKVPVRYFHQLESFSQEYLEAVPESPTLHLVDYHFRGSKETGLDLIERLGIASKSVLVTSHVFEEKINRRCLALGVKLLPKSHIQTVPIHVGA